MLENVPISGLAICYGPLALTIIGFIAFAVLTDADARRTYLRRLDPRTEEERGEEDPLPLTEPVVAATPSGRIVELRPDEETNAGAGSANTGPGAADRRSGAGFREGEVGPL